LGQGKWWRKETCFHVLGENMFPRNHGKTQHRKIIAGIVVKNGLDEVIRLLVKFGDAALFSDTQIAIAAQELTALEFELLYLRQENIELKARLNTNRAQVKKMAEEKRKICRVVNHIYIGGVCAECGKRETPPNTA
jgi:hypothetical protein